VVVATPDGTVRHLPAEGVFIEHGLVAETGFLGELVERTVEGQIVVNQHGATSCAGLFAAGDITNTAYAEQIVIALGEGTRAGLSASAYLLEGTLGPQEAPQEQITRYV
jgi:alkyl hydroperoxide reductase subunit F